MDIKIKRKSTVLKKIKEIADNTVFLKTIFIIGGWIVAFIPVYITAFFWWLIGPTTVIEKLLTIGLFALLVGWLQIILLIMAIKFTIDVADDL